MKPKEKKPEIVYRIIGKKSGDPIGSYSRACCDEFDFKSVSAARNANCHDMFQDKSVYKIAKYRVIYELIDDDCDGSEGVNPSPDGLPWDFDEWEESRKLGYMMGRNMARGNS